MKRIVECLLEEGIDESMVHRVLDLIEEEYEVVESLTDITFKRLTDASKQTKKACDDCDTARVKYGNDSEEAKKAWDKVNALADEEGKKERQFNTAVKFRDEKMGRHNQFGTSKSERHQKQADYIKANNRKDGQHGLDVQEIRQYQDAANGYPMARCKAENRHAKKLKKIENK